MASLDEVLTDVAEMHILTFDLSKSGVNFFQNVPLTFVYVVYKFDCGV